MIANEKENQKKLLVQYGDFKNELSLEMKKHIR